MEVAMNDGKVNWEGSLVAAVTPFTADGAIDERAFRENLALLISEGSHGLVISGCTGESWAMTPQERARLFHLAVDVAAGRVPVIAGTGTISTDAVIDLSLEAKAAGASGVMVLPPYYCMAGRREIVEHYRAISTALEHPILLYNVPRRTGFNLTPDVVEELAELEWVVAVKESSNDFVQTEATVRRVGDRILVFTGHAAERGVPCVLMGAHGYVSSTESQVMGRDALAMYDLAKSGSLARAREIQMRALALEELLKPIGTFPCNLKAAMNLLGRPGGYPRRPLLPLTRAQIDQVQVVLQQLNLAGTAA
jgi:4-hydroxy-tetrahydrodipicolinate synthase